MKKVQVFQSVLVLLLCLTVFSCKKNDESPSIKSQIIGKWKVSSYVSNSYEDGKVVDSSTDKGADGETFEFKSDGKLEYVEETGASAESGTWSLSSDEKSITISADGVQQTASISEISANKLTMATTFVELTIGSKKYKEETVTYLVK
jgi:hypothetical protein